MKNKGKYLLYICNIILIALIVFNITSYGIEEKEVSTSALVSEEGRYISYLKIDNTKKETLDNVVVEDTLEKEVKEQKEVTKEVEPSLPEVKTPVVETPKVVAPEPPKVEVPKQPEEVKKEEVKPLVLETLVGNIAGYGPDCAGCTSMKTASGKYIGEGNIYFDDATYGRVRIVAGDYSYPFGTIVKISNVDLYQKEPFYAVVLDRGGNIGKGKKFLFDLLFATESDAYQLGTEVNIKYEIMRLGY